jgi:hypothetical protein
MKYHKKYKYDIDDINEEALSDLEPILYRWLPHHRIEGVEYVALNPKRPDGNLGSFKINLQTAKWCDFATGDKGCGVVSLASYLFGLSLSEAAKNTFQMLGMTHD